MEMIGETLAGAPGFKLNPDYDATVSALGGEPPHGFPEECEFLWPGDVVPLGLQQAVEKVTESVESTTGDEPKQPSPKRTG